MKKLILSLFAIVAISLSTQAQTQKDWYLIGGNISNLRLDLTKGATGFGLNLTPKVAWFVRDNLALGAGVNMGFNTVKDGGSTFSYDLGPLARYYMKNSSVANLNKSRFFLEGNFGFGGYNVKNSGVSSHTNGMNIGFGPGVAYFLNQNIALEGLLKYNYRTGFGNSGNNSNLNLNVGFQIHLPKSKVKDLRAEVKP